jgi:hypothetical protein
MTHLKRLALCLFVLTLTAGPLLAAPVSLSATPTIGVSHTPDSPVRRTLELIAYGVGAFGAIRIKDVSTLAKKFTTRAGAAAGDYKDGVAQAGGDWETNAKNSEGNYEQGVQAAIGRKAYGKGISSSGASKYTTRATQLGATRYGPGVAAGADDWAKNTQPYLQKLASLQLPPKGPRRSPANQARANMVATELGKMKEQGS